jgi:carbon monoxide dehydrogenase subunit G
VDLQHSFSVPIGIEQAWEAFTDIERIAPCLPGAAITSVDGDEFTGTAKVKLGPISLQYAGKGTWVSRDQSTYSAVIEAQGKDKRGNGTAGATISAHLEPDGSSTRVVVDTELKITGRPAQFGRGVIQDVGGKLLDQFAACLATRLAEPASGSAPAPAAALEGAPADTTTSAGAGTAAPAGGSGSSSEAGGSTASTTPREGPGPVPAGGSAEASGDGSSAGQGAADAGGGEAWPSRTGEAYPGPQDSSAGSHGTSRSGGGVQGAGGSTSSPGSASSSAEPVELDLGGVVGPVLLKRLAPVAIGVVVLVLLIRRLRR